jgi:hypothetical protein
MREAVIDPDTGKPMTLRKLGRLTDINSGRLSIIERGVPPTEEEARRLRTELGRALLPREVARP